MPQAPVSTRRARVRDWDTTAITAIAASRSSPKVSAAYVAAWPDPGVAVTAATFVDAAPTWRVDRATVIRAVATWPAASPRPTHVAARRPIATLAGSVVSCAAPAAAVRGRPRNVTPVALTKQATARAVVRARAPIVAAAANLAIGSTAPLPAAPNRPWNVSHSLAKPFSGGSPLIAAAPTPKASIVTGIFRPRPPRRFS